jgi:CRISPR/Cas system Type II protein with McrA/HNH and RuvC-like nuclease domain
MSKLFATVFERDKRRCVYCGRDLLTDYETFAGVEEDHLIPLSKGGDDTVANVVSACAVCNRLRGHFLPDIPLSAGTRTQFLHAIRVYVMGRRAQKMQDFISWTHPSK